MQERRQWPNRRVRQHGSFKRSGNGPCIAAARAAMLIAPGAWIQGGRGTSGSVTRVEHIKVALGFDRAYAPHAAALIVSLVSTSNLNARFSFIALHAEVDAALQARVEAAAPGAEFIWREIGENEVPAMAGHEHFSRAILFRLGLERHAPADWRRVLYLDVDAIAVDDITPLWRTDLEGAAIGAIPDCYVRPQDFAVRWGLEAERPAYFNSGVLLIDLDRVREEGLFQKAIAFVAANQDDIRFTDQDALNFACWGKWKRLDGRWNVQRHMVIPALIEETDPDLRLNGQTPAIIHYTSAEKPWLRDGYHPWAWAYWRNLRKTAFYRDVSSQTGVGWLQQVRLWQRYMRAAPWAYARRHA
jgi:lipopolysaccharide biosynthesis glycosyltransferase